MLYDIANVTLVTTVGLIRQKLAVYVPENVDLRIKRRKKSIHFHKC